MIKVGIRHPRKRERIKEPNKQTWDAHCQFSIKTLFSMILLFALIVVLINRLVQSVRHPRKGKRKTTRRASRFTI